MRPQTPPSYSYQPTVTRTRVKWDNIAIVLMGAVVATFAVIAIMMTADTPATKPAPKPAPTTDSSELLEESAVDAAAGELTLDDATALVEEARGFMGEARWDEAADRLATIPDEFRAQVQADAVEAELAQLRARHDQLRAELTAAVEARQWKQASVLLVQLAKIATLDASLLELKAQVQEGLTGVDATPRPQASEPRPAATSGGGSTTKPANQTSTSKPASSRPSGGSSRPSGSTSRPSGTSGGGSSSNTSNTSGSTNVIGTTNVTTGNGTISVGDTTIDLGELGGVNVTDEELAAALAQLG